MGRLCVPLLSFSSFFNNLLAYDTAPGARALRGLQKKQSSVTYRLMARLILEDFRESELSLLIAPERR